MKNCPKCNAELNDDVVVCTECGEALEVVEAPQKKSKVSLILGIVGIILAFLFPLVGFIISVVGIILGVKELKTTGNKKGMILSIVGALLSIIVPIVSTVVTIALLAISPALFDGLLRLFPEPFYLLFWMLSDTAYMLEDIPLIGILFELIGDMAREVLWDIKHYIMY